MKPIRVLHIIGKMDRAGAETMLMNLYRHIDRTQVQFDFITFTTQKGDYDEEILALGGKIIPIIAKNPITRMFKLYFFLKKHPEYYNIHSHVLLHNAFHLMAAYAAGLKNRISHSHNTSSSRLDNGFVDKISHMYENTAKSIINRLATHKIACGSEAGLYLYNNLKNVLILPNAVDIKEAHKISNINKIKPSKDFDSLRLNIIHVARFMPVKNHEFILNIARNLIEKNLEFTIYLIGDGLLRPEIENKIIKYGLTNYVKTLGIQSDIIRLMSQSDIMLLPSFYEGFPVVLVESQAVGLPALVSNRISKEVDLGLGLVNFLNIDEVSPWVDAILNFQSIHLSNDEIFNKLAHQGFDISSNSEILTRIYSK